MVANRIAMLVIFDRKGNVTVSVLAVSCVAGSF